jgi:hypothetical protein
LLYVTPRQFTACSEGEEYFCTGDPSETGFLKMRPPSGNLVVAAASSTIAEDPWAVGFPAVQYVGVSLAQESIQKW